MPLYEYQCRSCTHRFEELVRASDEAPSCPSCAGRDLEKLLSAFAVATGASAPAMAAGPCGSCGDPRGPGACRLN
ncbi:MAG TPA: zinc ribbon domain-containing protein [Pseudomonadota bacterium]|nr:zinc ribbon domain-containing protein [Pseudomonadota bacterium]